MPTSTKKKWTVNPSSGESVVIEADRLELDDARVRATFFTEDGEVVAAFTGFNSLYPVADSSK